MAGSIIDNMPPQDDDASRRQRDLARKQREDAAAGRAAFDTTVQSLEALINTQVVPTQASSSASGYALNTSWQELTRVTFTVPSGYTQAQILGVGSVSCFNQSTSQIDQIWGQVDINGAGGPAQPGFTPLAAAGNLACSFSRLMTGLTGGSTFYVRVLGHNQFGNTGATSPTMNTCTLTAQVLFLR